MALRPPVPLKGELRQEVLSMIADKILGKIFLNNSEF